MRYDYTEQCFNFYMCATILYFCEIQHITCSLLFGGGINAGRICFSAMSDGHY